MPASDIIRISSLIVMRLRQPHVEASCPQCQQRGKMVRGRTVKALVSVPLRSVQNAQYFFCRTETCPVVYYTAEAHSVYAVTQLRERVYQKEPNAPDVLIC